MKELNIQSKAQRIDTYFKIVLSYAYSLSVWTDLSWRRLTISKYATVCTISSARDNPNPVAAINRVKCICPICHPFYWGLVISNSTTMPLCALPIAYCQLSVPFCVSKYCLLRIAFRHGPNKCFVKLPKPFSFSFPGLLAQQPPHDMLDCNLLP